MIQKKFTTAIFAIVFSSALCFCWWKLSSIDKFQSLLVPGVAITLVSDQSPHFIFRGMGGDEARASFQIASVSKTLFAWAILKWAKENQVNIEHPIGNIFSSLSTPLLYHFSQVTISQILSHRSGISSIQYTGYRNPNYCPDLYSSLSGCDGYHPPIKLIKAPGTSFAYSGAGYTLLEYLITQKEQCSTLSFLDRYFDESPQNCSSAEVSNRVVPHSIFGISMDQRYFIEKAAAGLWASASTMATFLKKILSNEEKDFLNEMVQSRESGYGLGIELEKMEYGHFCFHLGANPGWRSGIFFVPERQLGLAVLTNSCSGQRVVMDTLKKWLFSNGLSLPDLCRRELFSRKIWMVLSWLSFTLFFFRLFNPFPKKQITILSYLFLVVLLLSLAFLYLDSFPPQAWTVASFFPWEFHFFVLSVVLLVGSHFINHIIRPMRIDR